MSEVSARWVPRMLTTDQKSRLDISKYLLSLYEDDSEYMHGVVTQDETGSSLILRPKSRLCNGSSMAHPLLRNLREFFSTHEQGR